MFHRVGSHFQNQCKGWEHFGVFFLFWFVFVYFLQRRRRSTVGPHGILLMKDSAATSSCGFSVALSVGLSAPMGTLEYPIGLLSSLGHTVSV